MSEQGVICPLPQISVPVTNLNNPRRKSRSYVLATTLAAILITSHLLSSKVFKDLNLVSFATLRKEICDICEVLLGEINNCNSMSGLQLFFPTYNYNKCIIHSTAISISPVESQSTIQTVSGKELDDDFYCNLP